MVPAICRTIQQRVFSLIEKVPSKKVIMMIKRRLAVRDLLHYNNNKKKNRFHLALSFVLLGEFVTLLCRNAPQGFFLF